MTLVFQSCSLDQTSAIAEKLASLISEFRVMTLQGTLGSGKTTLAQNIIRILANDPHLLVPSPTFNYVHQYQGRQKIYHFDLYRLHHAEEVVAMGFDEMLQEEDAWVIIEWADVASDFLPKKIMQVSIEQLPGTSRKISVKL